MVTLHVKEMSCEHCVGRINKLLEELKIPHEVNLETKTVSVEGTEECINNVINELDDIGYTATK